MTRIKTYGQRMRMPFPFQRIRTQNELQQAYGLDADAEGYIIARKRISLSGLDTSAEEM